MRILIFGGEGMLGHKMFQVLSVKFNTYVTFFDREGPWRMFPFYQDYEKIITGVNAMDINTIIAAINIAKPDVIVNCIGIIKQLEESKNHVISIGVNSLFPHQLAELCRIAETRLIHVSTDCVFSGKKGNYLETDEPDASDLYGRSKYLGEVRDINCLTLRTSIFGRDFLKNAALLEWFISQEGKTVKGYRNVIYSGFPTNTFTRIVSDIIDIFPSLSGLYHVSTKPISKHDLLVKIRDKMQLDIRIESVEVNPIDLSLNCSRFIQETHYIIPEWDDMIDELSHDRTPYREWRKEHLTK